MRRVHREPLSEAAQARLCRQTWEIAAAGVLAVKHRAGARKSKAQALWENQTTNREFDEIRTTLLAMAPGNGLCMYCEISVGNTIEHFWPKQKYPGRAFTWENYLWSCSICNGDFKGTRFPRDEKGHPLLVNPADEDPHDHLEFSPATGKIEGTTPKGKATVSALGFERRGNLDKARKDAWDGLQELIVRYAVHCANGDTALALRLQRLICRHPFSTAFRFLLDIVDEPRGRTLVHPACVAVIETYPEMRHWP